jgi:hypothetical protein
MNERIKQLWSEAAESNFGDSWEEQTAFMSKFALLIVEEMLQTCEDHPGWSGRMIGEQIKEHFGVDPAV